MVLVAKMENVYAKNNIMENFANIIDAQMIVIINKIKEFA